MRDKVLLYELESFITWFASSNERGSFIGCGGDFRFAWSFFAKWRDFVNLSLFCNMPIDFNKDGKSLEQQVRSWQIDFRTAVILHFKCLIVKCVHFALYHVIHKRFAFLGNGGETWFLYEVKQFKLLFYKKWSVF